MTVKETLIKARELYASAPSHVSSSDYPADGTYCVITAVQASAPRLPDEQAACRALRAIHGAYSLVDFNARHTTEEVLALFDRAIEAA